jgi:hypothetical protein
MKLIVEHDSKGFSQWVSTGDQMLNNAQIGEEVAGDDLYD